MAKRITPEGSVKSAVCDLLDLYHIPWWRMNAGCTVIQSIGGRRVIKGQPAGTADILASPQRRILRMDGEPELVPAWLWIETKAPGGRTAKPQREVQYAFRREVEAQGHEYLLATSSDDVWEKLQQMGVANVHADWTLFRQG